MSGRNVYKDSIRIYCYLLKMEAFLLSYEPVSAINILTALYKRIEEEEWTNNCEKETENFVASLRYVLETVPRSDNERLKILNSFGSGATLKQRVSFIFYIVYYSLNMMDISPLKP